MSTFSATIKELERARRLIVRLEHELQDELAALPEMYGFRSVSEFITAVKGVNVRKPRRRRRQRNRTVTSREENEPKKNSPRRSGSRRIESLDAETLGLVRDLVSLQRNDAQIAALLGVNEATIARARKSIVKAH